MVDFQLKETLSNDLSESGVWLGDSGVSRDLETSSGGHWTSDSLWLSLHLRRSEFFIKNSYTFKGKDFDFDVDILSEEVLDKFLRSNCCVLDF